MAPAVVETPSHDTIPQKPQNGTSSGYLLRKPLVSTGALDKYDSYDITPVVGREFPHLDLTELINAPNADELLAELALTISQRGVVIFRKQDNLTNDMQKKLIQRIGKLSGKPSTSSLHIHPVLNTEGEIDEDRDPDQQISTISSKLFRSIYALELDDSLCKKKQTSDQWHSDVAFEPVPADYTSLRLTQIPKTGGDTLWASGYELYDRISPPFQQMLDSLTCTFARPDFNDSAARAGVKIYDKPRGAAENVGSVLRAVHPVVRTNPVTGWKSLYSVGQHIDHINGVTTEESALLLSWFKTLLKDNHDLQARVRWQNVNDMAIWDNRCTFHNATLDYDGLGDRSGNRAVGCGERPYYDPASQSRREALDGTGIGEYFMIR